MIDEKFLKGLMGKRVSIAIKNLSHVSGGILESVIDGNVCLKTIKADQKDPAKVYISVSDIASVLVY